MNYQIISDREVLHKSETQGEVITRVQILEMDGKKYQCNFWHNWETGRLVRVDSHPILSDFDYSALNTPAPRAE